MNIKELFKKERPSDVYDYDSLLGRSVEKPDERLSQTLVKLIDVMDLAMWELDLDYRIVGSNRKAKELYGDIIDGQMCHMVAAQSGEICDDCPTKAVYEGQGMGRTEYERRKTIGEKVFIYHIATPINDEDGHLQVAWL